MTRSTTAFRRYTQDSPCFFVAPDLNSVIQLSPALDPETFTGFCYGIPLRFLQVLDLDLRPGGRV